MYFTMSLFLSLDLKILGFMPLRANPQMGSPYILGESGRAHFKEVFFLSWHLDSFYRSI